MIWKSTYHSRIAQVADFLTVILGFIITHPIIGFLFELTNGFFPPKINLEYYHFILVIVIGISYILIFSSQNAYNYQRFTSLITEYKIISKVSVLGFLSSIAIAFMFRHDDTPRTYFIVFVSVTFILLIIEKTLLFYTASKLRDKGKNRKRIIIVGTGSRAENLIKTIKENFSWGLDVIGLLTGDNDKVGEEYYSIPVIGKYRDLKNIIINNNPEEIIITISTEKFEDIKFVMETCEEQGIQVRLNSDFLSHITKKVHIDNVYGLNIISFYYVHQSEFSLAVKRLIDIIGSSIALIIFSPLILIGLIGVWIADGRPLFYTYIVIGQNRKMIKVRKIRTMIKDAEKMKTGLKDLNEMDGPVFKIKNDPRILPFGKWLRKFSIDETPQLFSVLKGDLSLVGPRAPGPHEFEKFASWHKRKASIKPGLTCLWQINGRAKLNDFDEWIKLDLNYIDNWSIWLDIKILFKTIPVVLLGKGAS